jgi:hypothetical protein
MTDEAKVLREEMVAIQDERVKLFQVGITVLAALETALYYIRSDVHKHLGIADNIPLPMPRYIIGTAMLAVIALIFTLLSQGISLRYRALRTQYEASCKKDLPLPPRNKSARWLVFACYFAIPMLDLAIRLYLDITIKWGFQ